MTSICKPAVNASVVRRLVTSCMTAICLMLMLLVGHDVVVDGHQSRPKRTPPSGESRGIHDSKVVQDTEHISEHLQELKDAVNVSAMSHEELEFQYFRMHDFDNNTKLDGLEILKALTHLLPYEEDEETKVDARGKSADQVAREKREKQLLYYTEIVDTILDDDDIDNDGYLTYPEYIIARRSAEAQEEMSHSSSSSSSDRGSQSPSSGSHHHR